MAAVFGNYDSSDSWDSSDDELVVDHQEELAMVVSPSHSKIVDALKHLELDGTAEDFSDFERLDEYAMDHLFGFLSGKNLKNCRLVNKAWNRACLRVIPQQSHVVHVPKPVEKIIQLIALISSSDLFPWTKFQLNAKEITTIEEATAVHCFLAAVAPFINELGIDGITSMLYSINGIEFPSLKTIKFTCYPDTLGNGVGLVMDIVNGAIILDFLELEGNNVVMSSFLDLLETANGQKISGLVIKTMIKNEDMVRLGQLSLRLESLCLHFLRGYDLAPENIISSESLWTLLQNQSDYLKTLKLAVELWWKLEGYEDDGVLIPEVRFPKMPNLTFLSIGFSSNFRDINYATLFPALKTLQFDGFTDQPNMSLGFFHGGKNPVETLEVLKIGFSSESSDDEPYHIWCASKKFPNLRKMQLPNGFYLLQSLSMMVMPKLEELWLDCSSDGQSMDSEFCGIYGTLFESLCKLSVSNVKTMARTFEPLSCLKGIRKLVLVAGKGRQEPLLPSIHIAYYFGFLKMKRLETIELVGNVSEISEKGMAALQKKFKVIIRD